MSEEFQQTVDLKKKKESVNKKNSPTRTPTAKFEELEGVFTEKDQKNTKASLQKIEKFKEKQVNEGAFKKGVIILALILVGGILYTMLFKDNPEAVKPKLNWYAVKLITGEIYYGQIDDTKADPVVIKNVYYNYDQLKEGGVDAKAETKENSNIRLVKRGKETHGPDGSMDVVRAQVVYMEPLKEDSKVLTAILNYEK